jgi:manganese/zinc/iron transport system substrate-binding protein
MKKLFYFIIIGLLGFGCTESTKNETIVVTTNIIGNSLKEIIAEDVPIICLMNSETDPHSYQASPKDYELISQSKVLVSNGLHLEGKLHETLVQSAKANNTPHLLVSDTLSKAEIVVEEKGVADPHIWFDVQQWKKCINYTIYQLIKIYPQHKATWLARLEIYNKKLDACHKATLETIKIIPDSSKVLITAHDAFSYYSRVYHIRIKPLQGRNTITEPSIQDVIELSNYIVEHKIKAIFVETTVNKKFILSIQESCQSKGHKVKIGGELFSDALGREGTPESTYIGMIHYNTKTIANALK